MRMGVNLQTEHQDKFWGCVCIMLTSMVCTPHQVTWITPVIRTRLYGMRHATQTGQKRVYARKPERSLLTRPRHKWGMILKWTLHNRMGVNCIKGHAAPVFAGSVLLCRQPEHGYRSSTGRPCVSSFRAVRVSGLFTSRSGLWLLAVKVIPRIQQASLWREEES
jgi:hypothetical protein